MTLGSILLGLALLILVGLYLTRPFLDQRYHQKQFKTERQRLTEQKDALLYQIKSLEFDYDTGKIPEEVYVPTRQGMVTEAAAILQQLDQLPLDEAVDAEIETAVQQLRAGTPVPVKPSANGHTRYCANCGAPVDADDRFCASCGKPVTLPAKPVTT